MMIPAEKGRCSAINKERPRVLMKGSCDVGLLADERRKVGRLDQVKREPQANKDPGRNGKYRYGGLNYCEQQSINQAT